MKHRLEPDHDPLDLLIKGIFYVGVPLGSFIVVIAFATFGMQAVLP